MADTTDTTTADTTTGGAPTQSAGTVYYLAAGASRHKGHRYVRGDELPAEYGRQLVERGLAVADPAALTREDLRPLVPAPSEPKSQQRSTLPGSQTSAHPGSQAPAQGDVATATPVNVDPDGTVRVDATGRAPIDDDPPVTPPGPVTPKPAAPKRPRG